MRQKLTLLLSGQLSAFDNDYIIKSWNKLFSIYDLIYYMWHPNTQHIVEYRNWFPLFEN